MFKSGYIAFLGAPNVGKSTLLNAILKEKLAIVTPKPQTTRKKLAGIYSTATCQMIFLDVPGVHESAKALNQTLHHEITRAILDADVLAYMISVDTGVAEIKKIFDHNQKKYLQKKSILILNKVDLADHGQLPDLRHFANLPSYRVSAQTGAGLSPLLQTLESLLPEGPAYYPDDQLTDANLRDLAGEIIREKAMLHLHQEIPYALAVEILEFAEKSDSTRIQANLVVEQESQKGMVIGRGGQMIKTIGSEARVDLAKLLGQKVRLELKVKVDKKWTRDITKLKKYGYS